ncbi:MAG: hypothetical protein U9N78_00110 [Actinomycetota bacterium]|nr:hypothetical protein [Actinomycetota bacterium]
MTTNDVATYNDNPRIARPLFWVTAVESVVLLIAGTGLLLFPSIVVPEWPWDLSRFNALLLGAIYTASMFATVMTVYVQRWAPTRIVIPMIFLFTTIVLVVSLAYLDRFDLGKYSTWLWFLLYFVIPANALYHIWLARHLKPYYPYPMPAVWRTTLLVPTILLGLYGLGLLIAPGAFSNFWPWAIDDFHGRMYSVLYLTPALGALLLWYSAAAIEMLTLGMTVAVGGFIPLVGLAIVDRSVHKVDWTGAGTWLWIGSFAILFLAGSGLMVRSHSQEPDTIEVGSRRRDDRRTPVTPTPGRDR